MPAPMTATFSPGSDVGDRARRAARRPAARPAPRPRRQSSSGTACSWLGGRPGPRSSRRRCRGRSRSAGRPRGAVGRLRHSAGRPRAHSGQGGSMPRAAQPSAGWTTTRSPRRGPPPISPTTSWPGTNGRRRERGEVQRGLAGEQRLVGAADAGQRAGGPAASPGPGARGGRTSSSASAPAPGRPARRRRGTAASDRRVASAPCIRPPPARSSTSRPASARRRASRARRKSGLIGVRVADQLEHRQVGEAVAVGVAVGEVDAVVGGEPRGQQARPSAVSGGSASSPVKRPARSTSRAAISSSPRCAQRLDEEVQRAGDQDTRSPRRLCCADAADRLVLDPRLDEVRQRLGGLARAARAPGRSL